MRRRTHQFQLFPRVVGFETEDVPFERDKAELELLDIERAEYAEVREGGSAERGHARDDEEVVRVLISLRHRLDLFYYSGTGESRQRKELKSSLCVGREGRTGNNPHPLDFGSTKVDYRPLRLRQSSRFQPEHLQRGVSALSGGEYK